jgi:hypothetical protein
MFTFINITHAAAFRDRVASVLEVLGAQGVTAEDVRAEFLAAGENKLEGLDAWERLDRLENPTAAELRLFARVLRVNTTWLITGDVRFVPELMAGTCLCWEVPVEYHFTHYGATEPGSTHEFNPDCPAHALEDARSGARLVRALPESAADLFPVAAFGSDHAEEARA